VKTCSWFTWASILCGLILAGSRLKAADIATTETAAATQPADLPGLGLARHPFLYTGEWDHRNTTQTIFLVRGGKVVWTYQVPTKDSSGTMEELGDATLLSNGNVIFCRKVGASEVTPEKKIVWDIEAPKGTEIHSVQPIGLDHVLIVENGNPAKLMLINTTTGATEKETDLPTAHPKSPHLQFRRVRQLGAGSILAAQLDNNRVVEYDTDGKEIWSVVAPSPWSAERLANGDTLIGCSSRGVREVDAAGKTVWEFGQKDAPQIKLFIIQDVHRLANGNTVMCNWCPAGVRDPKNWPATVQVLEVTPEKKVVWALNSWTEPADLGPASSIQILDEPGAPSMDAFH
jgi:PQQ-like domain